MRIRELKKIIDAMDDSQLDYDIVVVKCKPNFQEDCDEYKHVVTSAEENGKDIILRTYECYDEHCKKLHKWRDERRAD